MKPKGLGKGLGALLGEETAEEQLSSVTELDVNQIDLFADQPRKYFDQEKLEELSASIKTHGIIQPLIVRRKGGRYTIVAGERRYRAARLAGLSRVPVIIKDFDEKQQLEISIIENIQRQDLNPMEEAKAIAMLMEDHDLTQEQVSDRIGRSRSAVANTLRLLGLPGEAQDMVATGALSAGHARTLLGLREKKKIAGAAKYVAEQDLSVRATEAYVKRLQNPKEKRTAEYKNPDYIQAEKTLSDRFETKVEIFGGPKRGSIRIHYFSEEQLAALYDVLNQEK